MAYNSDGYIMLDFAEVDFRRTNQTIEGLFDRCEKVIGTNKFVIVINANNKTPLQSTVCITNGQYVIESVLYTFSISSNDNLHITKKTTPEELIDDNHVTLKTTFSSNKIMSEIAKGDIKSFTYIGDGQTTHDIIFPNTPKYILGIIGSDARNNFIISPFAWNEVTTISNTCPLNLTAGPLQRMLSLNYNYNTLSVEGNTDRIALNILDVEYTVYYI